MDSSKHTNNQALLEPVADDDPNRSNFLDEDGSHDLAKSTAKSYWYLQVLVVTFMAIHAYTTVMLCICPLGESSNTAQFADGYGQCAYGGIVSTPWSKTSTGGWLNITLDTSDQNPNWWKGVAVLSALAVLMSLFIAAYAKASLSDPGYVMHLSKTEEILEDHDTYCSLCNVYKPPRCHHCSRCDRCVLKMDHHCIWINNCVGLYNYKFFFQLLCYGLVGTGFIGSIVVWRIVQVYVLGADNVQDWQLVMLFVALIFAFLQFIGIFYLLQFHIRLITLGRTNVEQVYQTYKHSDFDQGCSKNCVLALDGPLLCFLNPCCRISSRHVRSNFDVSQWVA